MPRTGENIYRRKDNRWEGRYIKAHKPSGKPIYGYVYAYCYKEVKAKLNLAISGKDTATRPCISSPTFSELAEQWLKSQKTRVKESTYNKYENNLRLYIVPHIGDICLKDLYRLFSPSNKSSTPEELLYSEYLPVFFRLLEYSTNFACQNFNLSLNFIAIYALYRK